MLAKKHSIARIQQHKIEIKRKIFGGIDQNRNQNFWTLEIDKNRNQNYFTIIESYNAVDDC